MTNHPILCAAAGFILLLCTPASAASTDAAASTNTAPTEYRLKAAILYNLTLYTEWPSTVGPKLNLCSVGSDPISRELGALDGKPVGARRIAVSRSVGGVALKDCHIVFVTRAAVNSLPSVLEEIGRNPALTVADTSGPRRKDIAINMTVARNRVTFEVNPRVARAAGLTFSSKLLRLATEVHQ